MKIKFRHILLVVPGNSSFYKPYIEVFETLGIKHSFFDYRKTDLIEKIIFALSKLSLPVFPLIQKHLNQRLIKKVLSLKPDIVFVIKGENILPETVKQIAEHTLTINYFSDYFRWFKETEIRAWLEAYDLLFTGDMADVLDYQKKGYKNIHHSPLAGVKMKDIPNVKKYEVVFVGAYSKEREAMFLKLAKLDFHIWGDAKWLKSQLKDNFHQKWLSADETLEVFKNAKIVVNFHNDTTGNNRYINLRVFEALSCHCLLITDVRRDLPTLFKIGQELVVYLSPEDLYNKVKYYLEAEIERKKISEAGYRRLNKEHTFYHRISKILVKAESLISKNKNK